MFRPQQRISVIAILFMFAGIVVSTAPLRAAAAQPIIPLPGGCINVTPPGNDQPVCCISGFVYVEGQPVAGAEVDIENAHGAKVTVTTQIYSGTESLPYYRLSLSAAPLNVAVGETITITAHYSGHDRSFPYQVQLGGQQVDVVLARNQADDYVFDHQIWHQAASGTFTQPTAIAVNSVGDIILLDAANARVQVFHRDRTRVQQWGTLGHLPNQFSQPQGIAVDRNDNVYVADSGNRRIQKFDGQGHLIAILGSPGDLDGQFNYPSGVAIDLDGTIYVSDTLNNRIQKFASDGTWLKSWGTKGAGNNQLQLPRGIAVSDSGEVFVADYDNDRIQVFSTNGDPLRRWSTQGQGHVAGEATSPSGVALDGGGNVYVTDDTRVRKFRVDGTWLAPSDYGAFAFSGIALDKSGHVYVAAARERSIIEYTTDVVQVDSWGNYPNADGQLSDPSAISIAQIQNGLIYVADRGSNRVQKFSSDGSALNSWPASYPTGVAADTAGNVYVAEPHDNRVEKRTSDGTVLATLGGTGSSVQFFNPTALAVDSGGAVYVADAKSSALNEAVHRIQKITSAGVVDPTWSTAVQFRAITGVAVDQNGNVYVTDRDSTGNNGLVQKLSSTGALVSSWHTSVIVRSPTGVSLDSSGNIYVTDTGDNNILQKFTSAGTLIATWGSNAPNWGLAGLAVDLVGKVYVVDDVNQSVNVFRHMVVAQPVGTITHLSDTSLNTADTLIAMGMGQVSVEPRTITGYRWTLDGATVLGAGATLAKSVSSFNPGSHLLTFEVQDSAGEWSPPVSKSFYVAKSVSAAQAQWTMLLYLDGDYRDGGQLLNRFMVAITELRQHFTNPAVRIAIQLDGPANGDTRRFTIAPLTSPSGVPQVTETPVGELAMDDQGTLVNFIQWGQQQFPAAHYYLAIADHGQAVQGIGWDSTSDPNDGAYLTVKELGDALRSPGIAPIDVLHLDACSLSLIDIAYEVRDNVKTLVASQYLGWSYFAYDDYAAAIGQASSAQDVARMVVDHYAALAQADNFPYTISALNLERSTTTLNAVDALAAELAAELNNNHGKQTLFESIRQASQKFDSDGHYTNNDQDMYVDLVDWTQRIQSGIDNPAVKARAAALLTELNGPQSFIIGNKARSNSLPAQYAGGPYINLSGAHGLSIFYPQQHDTLSFDSYVHDRLFSFSATSRWKDFLLAGVGALPAPGTPLEPLPGPLPVLSPNHVFLPLVVR